MESKKDRYFRIKYMGYCLAHLAPNDDSETTFEDFVEYCKFQLCQINKVLMHDPIWDAYNEEQILVEYYAHLYANDETAKNKFQAAANGVSLDLDDWAEWADSQIESNKKEQEELLKEAEDNISFSPGELGE